MIIHCFGKHMRKMNFYIPLVGQNDSRIFPESNVEILLYTSVHVCMYLKIYDSGFQLLGVYSNSADIFFCKVLN